MKKIPITIIPVIFILVVIFLFFFYVPHGGNLISSTGDYILGLILGLWFGISLAIDIKSRNK